MTAPGRRDRRLPRLGALGCGKMADATYSVLSAAGDHRYEDIGPERGDVELIGIQGTCGKLDAVAGCRYDEGGRSKGAKGRECGVEGLNKAQLDNKGLWMLLFLGVGQLRQDSRAVQPAEAVIVMAESEIERMKAQGQDYSEISSTDPRRDKGSLVVFAGLLTGAAWIYKQACARGQATRRIYLAFGIGPEEAEVKSFHEEVQQDGGVKRGRALAGGF